LINVGAEPGGVAQEDLVELRAYDLPSIGSIITQLIKTHRPFVGPPLEEDSALDLETVIFDLLPGPEQLQDRQRRRKDRLPDMIAGKMISFRHRDL
jgi:hypothetical protein